MGTGFVRNDGLDDPGRACMNGLRRPTGPCLAGTGDRSTDGTSFLLEKVLFNMCPAGDVYVPNADGTSVLLEEVLFKRGVEMVLGLGMGVVCKMGVPVFFRSTGEEDVR